MLSAETGCTSGQIISAFSSCSRRAGMQARDAKSATVRVAGAAWAAPANSTARALSPAANGKIFIGSPTSWIARGYQQERGYGKRPEQVEPRQTKRAARAGPPARGPGAGGPGGGGARAGRAAAGAARRGR